MGLVVLLQDQRLCTSRNGALCLPWEVPGTIVALGAESKGAYCVLHGRQTRLSDSFGSLTDPRNYRAYREALHEELASADLPVLAVVRDLHPHYVTADALPTSTLPVLAVQHHHAHVAACLAEHGIREPAVGVCCDGAGYGPDGASWGGEILYVTAQAFVRAAHLRYLRLPGSDAAAIECWRPAWGLVRQAYGDHVPDSVRATFHRVSADDLNFADGMLARGVQCPQTSSLGRLFDALAYLLGIAQCNTFEAEAARGLQAQAEALFSGRLLPMDVHEHDGLKVMDFAPAVRELMRRRHAGDDLAQLSADVHETIAAALAVRAVEAANRFQTQRVVLSGGCVANRLLVRRLRHRLLTCKLEVLEHQRTSCGDASLALGQAYVAAAHFATA